MIWGIWGIRPCPRLSTSIQIFHVIIFFLFKKSLAIFRFSEQWNHCLKKLSHVYILIWPYLALIIIFRISRYIFFWFSFSSWSWTNCVLSTPCERIFFKWQKIRVGHFVRHVFEEEELKIIFIWSYFKPLEEEKYICQLNFLWNKKIIFFCVF